MTLYRVAEKEKKPDVNPKIASMCNSVKQYRPDYSSNLVLYRLSIVMTQIALEYELLYNMTK